MHTHASCLSVKRPEVPPQKIAGYDLPTKDFLDVTLFLKVFDAALVSYRYAIVCVSGMRSTGQLPRLEEHSVDAACRETRAAKWESKAGIIFVPSDDVTEGFTGYECPTKQSVRGCSRSDTTNYRMSPVLTRRHRRHAVTVGRAPVER